MSEKINVERATDVVLYTRDGCNLCDDTQQLLLRHGVIPILVDIDADPALKSRFDTMVPVVEIDGRVRFRGRVEPVLLRRILRIKVGTAKRMATKRHEEAQKEIYSWVSNLSSV